MITQGFQLIKALLLAGAVVVMLQMTGLWGGFTSASQRIIMTTGALDADTPDISKSTPDFDYNFTIKDLEGKRISIDQLKGKVIFLNLWATWCGPCRAEMPTIQALYNEIPRDSIAFIMLSIDRDSDKEKIVRYIQKNEYTFPVYQPSGYLTQQLDVPSIPTTIVVSKQGKIVAREIGTTNFNTTKFKRFIQQLANQ